MSKANTESHLVYKRVGLWLVYGLLARNGALLYVSDFRSLIAMGRSSIAFESRVFMIRDVEVEAILSEPNNVSW
jgi:hypothetical protein